METLPYSDLLTTLAEVAATFVGFSMIASVIRPESDAEKKRFFRFRHVAEASVGSVFSALLPSLIFGFGVNSKDTFFYASAFCLVGSSIALIASWREVGVVSSLKSEPLRTVMTLLLNTFIVVLLFVNVISPGPHSAARYVAAVISTLIAAGLIFIGATFAAQNARQR
jgi:hypothetical protein